MLYILIIGVILLLALGLPIFVALGLPPVLIVALEKIPLTIIVQRIFGGLDRFALMAMPFFIFAANIMSIGGMSHRIVRLSEAIVGRFYGGVALTTTLACMFFGALSGSSPATVVAIGKIAKPLLDQNKYESRFSLGLIMASSSLAILIPPSITMIIYAVVTRVSVGQLFLAGVGPGVLMGVLYMIYSYIYAKKHQRRSDVIADMTSVRSAFKSASWALGVPVIILGGIYGGVFTPTEAATVSATYALIVGFIIYRELTWKTIINISRDSAVVTAQIMILVATASVFSWALTIQDVQSVIHSVLGWAMGVPWIILIIMNLTMIIAGMFVDPAAIILILGPLFVPIVVELGISPVHMGVIMVANSAIGMYSPPFGLNLFIAKGVFRSSFSELVSASIPFVLISIIGLLIITFIPQISLWLPAMAYGR
ncbi:MAG: TRAP transporter large permease subunit [Bacillota bacterium]